jgi:hypothetical protein
MLLERNRMGTHRLTTWLGLVVVLGILICEAYHPLWRPHLQADVVVFQKRALSFMANSSWGALGRNEYQPGALWFFVLLGFLTARAATFDAFLTTTVLVNSFLIAAHVFVLSALRVTRAVASFLLLTLATGPILLYRFELVTSLLVLGAWCALQRGLFVWAAGMLGFAIAIKVYPLVLVPICVAAAVQSGGWRLAGVAIVVGVAAVATPVVAVQMWDGTFTGLIDSLKFHQLKPVGLDGLWAGVIVALQTIGGMPVRMTSGYGTHGLTSDLPLLTNRVLDAIWLLPYVFVLWLMWRSRHHHLFRTPLLPFTVLLVLVVFAKVTNPQYLWWFASLAALIGPLDVGRRLWWVMIALLCVSAGLTQLVYPVHYTEFLNWFRTGDGSAAWFAIAVFRNCLLLAVTTIAIVVLATQRKIPSGAVQNATVSEPSPTEEGAIPAERGVESGK